VTHCPITGDAIGYLSLIPHVCECFHSGKQSCSLSPGGATFYETVDEDDEDKVNSHFHNKTALMFAKYLQIGLAVLKT